MAADAWWQPALARRRRALGYTQLMTTPATLLALDTSTEWMSLGLQHGGQRWLSQTEGGAQASQHLIGQLADLLRQAGLWWADLDAIVFGQGPGAFTGLRTACSVAQGLAYGANKPVVPVVSLLAVAEDARSGRDAFDAWAAMDARMGEIYAAHYTYALGQWKVIAAPALYTPASLVQRLGNSPPQAVCGNALTAFAEALPCGGAEQFAHAMPRASALLNLGQDAWRRGLAVPAAQALPLYVRDRVALTTAEREAARSDQKAAGIAA